jgi:hypothetical protein
MFHRVEATHQAKASGSFAERIRPAMAEIGSCRETRNSSQSSNGLASSLPQASVLPDELPLRGLGIFGFKLRDVVFTFRR